MLKKNGAVALNRATVPFLALTIDIISYKGIEYN